MLNSQPSSGKTCGRARPQDDDIFVELRCGGIVWPAGSASVTGQPYVVYCPLTVGMGSIAHSGIHL